MNTALDAGPPASSATEHPETLPGRARALLERDWARNIAGLLVLVAIVGGLIAIDAVRDGRETAMLRGVEIELGAQDGRVPDVGEPAPEFALRDADGNVRQLSDFRGQVVWVNFWATWCGPCKRELPDIQKLADEYADRGLVVLAVNQRESTAQANEFWAELGLDLPILLDSDGDVSGQYRLRGLPDNFFIDRDGVLRAFAMGFLTEEQMRDRLAEAGLT